MHRIGARGRLQINVKGYCKCEVHGTLYKLSCHVNQSNLHVASIIIINYYTCKIEWISKQHIEQIKQAGLCCAALLVLRYFVAIMLNSVYVFPPLIYIYTRFKLMQQLQMPAQSRLLALKVPVYYTNWL